MRPTESNVNLRYFDKRSVFNSRATIIRRYPHGLIFIFPGIARLSGFPLQRGAFSKSRSPRVGEHPDPGGCYAACALRWVTLPRFHVHQAHAA